MCKAFLQPQENKFWDKQLMELEMFWKENFNLNFEMLITFSSVMIEILYGKSSMFFEYQEKFLRKIHAVRNYLIYTSYTQCIYKTSQQRKLARK